MAYNDNVCAVCGRALIESDDFYSCPVYMEGKSKKADEHTSFPIEERE